MSHDLLDDSIPDDHDLNFEEEVDYQDHEYQDHESPFQDTGNHFEDEEENVYDDHFSYTQPENEDYFVNKSSQDSIEDGNKPVGVFRNPSKTQRKPYKDSFGDWDEPEYDHGISPKDYETMWGTGDEEEYPVGRRRRRRRWLWLLCCCCCLLLLLLLLLLPRGSDKPPPEVTTDDGYTDGGWQPYRPYLGVQTTPMDPYVKDDCYFGDNVFPHVIQQCECYGVVSHIPDDVANLYYQIRKDITDEIYNGGYVKAMDSCDPRNLALIWLSSGNTRDAGDLYQRFVLATNFIQLNGTVWDEKNLWLSDDSECMWIGMQCHGNYRVNNLAVDTNNIHGSLPSELAYLEALETLSITRAHLTGTIPSSILLMPNLKSLSLYANQLRGSIPTWIGQSSTLQTLRLDTNLFFGPLVTEVGNVTTLEQFSVGFNQFWKKIPTEMGRLTNMKWLVMENNRFSGTLPTVFGQMTDLEYFSITNNLMIGTIPTELQNVTKLQELRIANTGLGGTFPSILGYTLSNLNRLEMGFNNFKGTIMTEFGLMTRLHWLALNDNDLEGTIPTYLGELVNMTRLSLQNTLLNGTIPSELGLMTGLKNLAMQGTNIIGTVPGELCALRGLNLVVFVTDCPARGGVGVQCPIPDCCSFCRRGES